MFNPLRLTLARKRRGMKKRELAEKIGLTEKSVSNYEAGSQEPESTTLSKLSEALRFPEAFFFGDDPEVPTPDVASFRSLSKMSAPQRDSALGAGAVALLLNDWIESRFQLPDPDVPDLGREGDPPVVCGVISHRRKPNLIQRVPPLRILRPQLECCALIGAWVSSPSKT